MLSPGRHEEWLRSYWKWIAGRLARGMLAADAPPGHRRLSWTDAENHSPRGLNSTPKGVLVLQGTDAVQSQAGIPSASATHPSMKAPPKLRDDLTEIVRILLKDPERLVLPPRHGL